MKNLFSFLFTLSIIGFGGKAFAQEDIWPRTINAQDGSVIKIYEPDPESFSGNILKTRAAISLLQAGKTDPVFGTYWAVETVETDRDDRRINITSVKVPNVKFSGDIDANTINYVKTTLESQIPVVQPDLSQDAILASLETNTEEKKLSKDLENNAPKIIYSDKPSILVLIDGEPKLQNNSDWKLDAVVNTPFTIVKNNDGRFYLYGGKHWYNAAAATGPYKYVSNPPSNLAKVQTAVDNANTDPGFSDSASAQPDVVSDIIVSTTPAELIQTNGKPALSPIDSTSLSYINNTQNDIFRDNTDGEYYVLISGRWYKSAGLNGPWNYTAANALPADFSRIPAGSPKDNVLASVAGTNEAREAVMDAQIPQTAKVDRKNATASVTYDGDPQFENIQGTNMQYAVNTQSSVLLYRGRYYCVDNGVWFESGIPNGGWQVCIDRPDEVDIIPPSSPVYNVKYVYIYDVSPDWVYMGYTPGYLNTFIYGPTIVYGTGFYYRPWWGHYYYPRPYTWGFSMNYNPWAGWSIGYGYRYNWFHVGFGVSVWNGWRGGWWGPAVYRPPYRPNPYRSYGYYGRPGMYGRPAYNGRPAYGGRPAVVNNRNRVNVTNNIYNFRRDVVTRNNTRNYNQNGRINNNNGRIDGRNGRPAAVAPNANNRPTPQVTAPPRATPQRTPAVNNAGNNLQTDREGNVYRNNNNPQQWQQQQQGQWKPVENTQPVVRDLNRQQQMRTRGEQRLQNFERSREASPTPRPTQTYNPQRTAPTRPSAPQGSGGGMNRSGGQRGGGRR